MHPFVNTAVRAALNEVTLADIAIGCALGWLSFRFPDKPWREHFPNLARHLEKLEQRQAFIDTAPPPSLPFTRCLGSSGSIQRS